MLKGCLKVIFGTLFLIFLTETYTFSAEKPTAPRFQKLESKRSPIRTQDLYAYGYNLGREFVLNVILKDEWKVGTDDDSTGLTEQLWSHFPGSELHIVSSTRSIDRFLASISAVGFSVATVGFLISGIDNPYGLGMGLLSGAAAGYFGRSSYKNRNKEKDFFNGFHTAFAEYGLDISHIKKIEELRYFLKNIKNNLSGDVLLFGNYLKIEEERQRVAGLFSNVLSSKELESVHVTFIKSLMDILLKEDRKKRTPQSTEERFFELMKVKKEFLRFTKEQKINFDKNLMIIDNKPTYKALANQGRLVIFNKIFHTDSGMAAIVRDQLNEKSAGIALIDFLQEIDSEEWLNLISIQATNQVEYRSKHDEMPTIWKLKIKFQYKEEILDIETKFTTENNLSGTEAVVRGVWLDDVSQKLNVWLDEVRHKEGRAKTCSDHLVTDKAAPVAEEDEIVEMSVQRTESVSTKHQSSDY